MPPLFRRHANVQQSVDSGAGFVERLFADSSPFPSLRPEQDEKRQVTARYRGADSARTSRDEDYSGSEYICVWFSTIRHLVQLLASNLDGWRYTYREAQYTGVRSNIFPVIFYAYNALLVIISVTRFCAVCTSLLSAGSAGESTRARRRCYADRCPCGAEGDGHHAVRRPR